MLNCEDCNYKFTFKDRLKSISSTKAHLDCPSCHAVYRPMRNLFRSIYYFFVTFPLLMIILNVSSNFILKLLVYVITATILMSLFDLVPHKWNKYEMIKK